MSLWRRSLSYLGLAADEWDEHDGYEAQPHQSAGPTNGAAPATMQPAMPSQPDQETGRVAAVKPVVPMSQSNGNDAMTEATPGVAGERSGSVIQMGRVMTAKVHTTSPTSFSHAKDVADHFKADQPVIMNLQGLDRDTARRLIDFASGLCYGLGGKMDKVAAQVFMLTPADVEVSAEDRRRLQERGLYDD